MNVVCPSCGAAVEFRYDDSFVRVCDNCRSAVVRTDRGVETLGQFADLMPIASPLRLFAEGHYGATGFLLIGMAQLRHAAGGVWQEWYARVDGGTWAWISEAQGRLYLTFERSDVAAPPPAGLAPGARIALAGTTYTVAERGTATYVSALGEIPYRLVPASSFHFADLSDERGGFATIDYGDGSGAPTVYLGYQVTADALGLSGGEAAAQAAPAQGARLACPNCNGPLELRVPDQTLRIACPYCSSLVSVEGGALSIIAQQCDKPVLAIALGTTGRFAEGELTVVGYVGRSAHIDRAWWPFDEYLLYSPKLGFRWLICSDGHWSYGQPVASGAVTREVHATYDGVTFRRFAAPELKVTRVLGEFYWRVEVGERVKSEDYIAPPAMLSREATQTEQSWTLASYLTPREVSAAFGTGATLPPATGVAPNQPYPGGVGKAMALSVAVLLALGIGKCTSSPSSEKLHAQFAIPMTAAPAASDAPAVVLFSDPFRLERGKNVAFVLSANVTNNWIYAAVDLVNDDTGGVVSFDKSIEYYAGSDSDGSWTEGSNREREVIGPVDAGNYVLRVEGQHGGLGNIDLDIDVRQGVFEPLWLEVAFGALAVPFALVLWHAISFRKRRWLGSDAAGSGGIDD